MALQILRKASLISETSYDPVAVTIKTSKDVDSLYNFTVNQHGSFSPYHWIAVANRMQRLDGSNKINSFISYFKTAQVTLFSWPQLHRLTQFFHLYDVHTKIYQTYLEALLHKTTDSRHLIEIISTHGNYFSGTTWIMALEKVKKLAPSNQQKLLDHLIPQNLGSNEDVAALKDYLTSQRLPTPAIPTRSSLDPELLSAKLQGKTIRYDSDFSAFLRFVKDQIPKFNPIHWAIFAGVLHQASKTKINVLAFQNEIREIVVLLPESEGPWSHGLIAQVIGGCTSFLDTPTTIFLKDHLTSSVSKLSKKECIMIILGIRLASRKELAPFLQLILTEYLSKPEALMKSPDLFAALVHCSGKLMQVNYFDIFVSLIRNNSTNFSAIEASEILQGLASYSKENIPHSVPPDVIEILVRTLYEKIPLLLSGDRSRALVQSNTSLNELNYRNEKWSTFCIQEASALNFPIWSKIVLLDRLNFKATSSLKEFVKTVTIEYLSPKYDYLRSKYPWDGIKLAFIVERLFKNDERMLFRELMKKIEPFLKTEKDLVQLNKLKNLLQKSTSFSIDRDDFTPVDTLKFLP